MKRWRGVLFGLACALWLLVLPVSLFMAAMSPLLSDAGVSTAVWILIGNFVTFPLACLLCPVAGWIAYRKGRRRLAWGLAAAPLLWVIVPTLAWSYLASHSLSP